MGNTRLIQLAVILVMHSALFSQTTDEFVSLVIPEIAQLTIEPNNGPVTFEVSVTPIAGAGEFITDTDESRYLNYSCALSSTSSSRVLYAELSSGSLPSGLILQVELGPPIGTAEGQLANPVGPVELSTSPSIVGDGIRGCKTGSGPGTGHNLLYEIIVDEENDIGMTSGVNPLVVTYTLADD